MAGEASSTTKITPDTYSGVALVAMEKVDSTRSVREPSRIPAKTPISSATGTITSITANISQPVAAIDLPRENRTVFLKTVDTPQLP